MPLTCTLLSSRYSALALCSSIHSNKRQVGKQRIPELWACTQGSTSSCQIILPVAQIMPPRHNQGCWLIFHTYVLNAGALRPSVLTPSPRGQYFLPHLSLKVTTSSLPCTVGISLSLLFNTQHIESAWQIQTGSTTIPDLNSPHYHWQPMFYRSP